MEATVEHRQAGAYNQEVLNFNDISTWIAETLNGQMQTSFDFEFNGQDLVAEDGRCLSPIFVDALEDAKQKQKVNPAYGFEVRRRQAELDECDQILEMANGETDFNTIIVVSDHPEEVIGEESFGGYDAKRKKTMLRVITKNPDGTITVTSQSLDKSDRDSLEAIYDFMGCLANEGELLGQRITADIDPKFQVGLIDRLTRVYDAKMSDKFGGDWLAGRSPGEIRNTFEFAQAQTDLIDVYLNGSRDERSRYNLFATVSARFESHLASTMLPVGRDFTMTPIEEMEYYGRIASSMGVEFSGCGETLKRELEQQLSGLGYNDEDKKTSSQMRCVNCPECKTFHETVRNIKGKPVCDNPDCKLSDKHNSTKPKKDSRIGAQVVSLSEYLAKPKKPTKQTA